MSTLRTGKGVAHFLEITVYSQILMYAQNVVATSALFTFLQNAYY